MRSRIRFFAVCLLLVAILPSASFADGVSAVPDVSGMLSEFELGKYQYCGTDSDCIKANNGCCDCANGGADVAVNRKDYDSFRARFDCLHVNCTERARIPACASGVVSCVNHKCKYFDPS